MKVSSDLNVKNLTSPFKNLDDLIKFVNEVDPESVGNKMMVVEWNQESKYIKIKCANRGCVFQHWFTFDLDRYGEPNNILMFRNINANHSIEKHSTKLNY